MLLPVPKELTRDGVSSDWNPVLSDGDKRTAARYYPFPGAPVELPLGGTSLPVDAEALRVDRYQVQMAAGSRYTIDGQGPAGAEVVLFGPDSDVRTVEGVQVSDPVRSGVASNLAPGV
jgi:hypothetical protein